MSSPIVITQEHFDWATLTACRAMRHYDISVRQRKFLDYLLLRSFDVKQTRAKFDSYNEIVDGTGIYKGDIGGKGGVIYGLRDANVIEVQPWPPPDGKDFSALYGINILFDNWDLRVSNRYLRAQQQLLGLKFPDELRDAILENFVECRSARPLHILPVSTGASPALRQKAPDGDVHVSASPRDSRDTAGTGNGPRRYFPSPQPGRPGAANPGGAPESSVGKSLTVAKAACPASVSEALTQPWNYPLIHGKQPPSTVSDSPTVGTGARQAAIPPIPPVRKRRETKNEDKYPTTETAKGERGRVQRGGAHAAAPGNGPAARKAVDVARAVGLYRELEEFFAVPSVERWQAEMNRSADHFWRPKVIQNFPDALEQGLAEGRDMDRSRYEWKWKPAWLTFRVGQLARVKNWDKIRPGPEPRD